MRLIKARLCLAHPSLPNQGGFLLTTPDMTTPLIEKCTYTVKFDCTINGSNVQVGSKNEKNLP